MFSKWGCANSKQPILSPMWGMHIFFFPDNKKRRPTAPHRNPHIYEMTPDHPVFHPKRSRVISQNSWYLTSWLPLFLQICRPRHLDDLSADILPFLPFEAGSFSATVSNCSGPRLPKSPFKSCGMVYFLRSRSLCL